MKAYLINLIFIYPQTKDASFIDKIKYPLAIFYLVNLFIQIQVDLAFAFLILLQFLKIFLNWYEIQLIMEFH